MLKRQHRFAMLKYIKGNIWLLIIPIVRGLISLKSDFYSWFKMTYMDIFVIIVVFALAWLKWYRVQFEFSEKGIYVKKGVVVKSEFFVPYSVISCVVVYQSILMRAFKIVKINIETETCSGQKRQKKKEIFLIVSEIDYSQIYKNIPINCSNKKIEYHALKKDIVIYSMCFSSVIPGLIYIGSFIIQGKKIVGEKIEIEFLSVVNELTDSLKKFTEDISAIILTLLIIIAVGWFISFILKLIRYSNFKICRLEKNILIENGHFSNWKYYVNSSSVHSVEIRQNLIMKLAKKMSLYVNCAGYGEQKNEQPIFVPMTTKKRGMGILKELLPDFTKSNNMLTTKRALLGYIWLPLILVVGVAVVTAVLCTNFYNWAETIQFAGIMLEIPLVYFLAVQIVAKVSTGIGVSDRAVTMSYCRAAHFHTVIVLKERIAYIKIRRTFFQRASGCCDVIVYTGGRCVKTHRMRGIIFKDAEKLVENYDKTC